MRHLVAASLFAATVLAISPLFAQTIIPQQERMRTCNTQAGQQKLSGDARRQFMSQCLSGRTTAEKPLNAQQQKMKDCNASASAAKLSGERRSQFMTTCLKGATR